MKNGKQLTPQILALYLGCEVETPHGVGFMTGIDTYDTVAVQFAGIGSDLPKTFSTLKIIHPILRPLSDITEGEEKWIESYCEGRGAMPNAKDMAAITAFLLSCGFDLFGLIDAGLAIDKTKSESTAI